MPATSIDPEAARCGKQRAGNHSANGPARPDLQSFLDTLLEEQQRLQTPVVRFAGAAELPGADRPSPIHSDLIPLTAPAPGEQYAFEVDLDACSGCKACVAGCHSLNGLDEQETWRDVGLVLGGDNDHPFQQTITSACHHCEDPACANGCPVLAYEKDPLTGIVRHLDDQCIGCSYCILKCPYDVPKFNVRLGIVRKCDMCHGRLAAGEAPACAQACPTHAISIVKVRTQSSAATAPEAGPTFLPAAPEPSYTRPTTRYVSTRPLPANLRAADAHALRPQPAHWPLVVTLVLTQVSLGLLAAALLVSHYDTPVHGSAPLARAALASGVIGVLASVLHLGQPLRAWRVFLGLRRSWLSREAVLFAAYLPLVAATAFLPAQWLPIVQPVQIHLAALATGAIAVACSIMIYADTRRRFWRVPNTTLRMGGSAVVATLAFVAPALAATGLAAKLILESFALSGESSSARLHRGPLRRLVVARFALGATAAAIFTISPVVAFSLFLIGEFAERAIFFRAVDAPKMPGMPGTLPHAGTRP